MTEVAIEKEIEKAKKFLDATSSQQDSYLIAELINNLGLTLKSTKFESIANGIKLTDPYIQRRRIGPDQIINSFLPDDDGEAFDDDKNPVRSVGQQLDAIQNQIDELWKAADNDGIRRPVEEVMPEVQGAALQKMKSAQQEG